MPPELSDRAKSKLGLTKDDANRLKVEAKAQLIEVSTSRRSSSSRELTTDDGRRTYGEEISTKP